MYEAVMMRDQTNIHHGFYVKKFDNLESFVKYITLPANRGRLYKMDGLSHKEKITYYHKCLSVLQNKYGV